ITLAQYMEQLMNSSDYPDTFCMIESIEHIPEDETMAAVHQMRARGNCMLIVTNAIDAHPLYPDGTGWNHITLVDDRYYERLSKVARRTVLQSGSHLVLEF